MNILIVDDEKFNLRMAADLIKENIPASDIFLCNMPEFVIDEIEKNRIDIILLDIIMPKINGIEVLKNIRTQKKYKDIQVIMFTGLTDKENLKLCFENGANDYINKPINVIEFVARMQASVKARQNILSLLELTEKISEQYLNLQRMTQQLKDTQFNLMQKEKLASLGEIAAGIAHEINTPIGFISGNFETMKQYIEKIQEGVLCYRKISREMLEHSVHAAEELDQRSLLDAIEGKYKLDFILEDFKEMITESIYGAERVTKIVKNLQTLAKTGTENEMVYNDLNQIVEEGLMLVKPEIQDIAEIDKQTEGSIYLLCNKGQIGHVILNILSNAIYAIKNVVGKAFGRITVRTFIDGDFAVCQIQDTGTGIKDEYRNRVFDPFFTTKEVGDGVGLGLSVAYDIIVKKHEGEFFVESEMDQWSTFTIKLPVKGNVEGYEGRTEQ